MPLEDWCDWIALLDQQTGLTVEYQIRAGCGLVNIETGVDAWAQHA